MPGYQTKQDSIAITGAADLVIRSLLDRTQFSDPHGLAQRAGISSAQWPLFGLPWPSGARLAACLASWIPRPGVRVLEVGCGLALASLVGHRLGLDMTASDVHPLAAGFLAENLRLNGLPPMKYRHADWAAPRAPDPGRGEGRYGLLIGSDLLYDRDAAQALAGHLLRHAAARSAVWIVDPERGNRAGFTRTLAAAGFTLQQHRLDTPAGPAAPAYRGRLLVYSRG